MQLRSLFLVSFSLATGHLAQSAPTNDDFADAYLLRDNFGTLRGSNVSATIEDGEPYHADNEGGASVWYYWTAPRYGLYRFDTLGSNFDTLLGIYSGTSVDNLSLIGRNDDAGSLSTSSVIIRGRTGSEYEIAIDGYNDGTGVEVGSLQLTWEQINPPQADFNRDNRNDFLLFAPSSGAIRYIYLNDRTYLGRGSGPTVPYPYEVSDTGDFNLDEQPDVVLRNVQNNRTAIWMMQGGRFSASTTGPTIPSGYNLAAVDDFNDDGDEDFLLQNLGNGRTAIWNLSAGRYVSTASGPTLPSGWEIAGAADINIDGNPDIVLYQKSSGRTAFWLWNGRRVVGTLGGPTVPSGYRLTGVADYNRDGNADLVIISPSSGNTYFWTMSRERYVASNYGPRIAAGYGIAAPR